MEDGMKMSDKVNRSQIIPYLDVSRWMMGSQ